jgi:hypothetical protein
LYIVSPGGQIAVNNLSVEPRDYHVTLTGKSEGSQLNYNAYVPDGRFHLQNAFDTSLDRQLQNLQAFQAELMFGRTFDEHSLTAYTADFVNPAPQSPEDFRLMEISIVRGQGAAMGLGDGDFGGRARDAARKPDIGAWAWYPSDS